jgi:hypothetical protein
MMDEVVMEEEKEVTETPAPGTMALAGDGTMIETVEDGETKVVHTASRWLGDMAKARKGYISPEEAAREARAMKEILLAKEGMPVDPDDLSKGLRFVDWSKDEDIKNLVEYKRVGVFVPRDVEHEPRPGDEGGYVGQFAPGDYILFDPARDIRFPLSDDAPIPLVDEEIELTLRDNAHKIELFLMNYPLSPIPVYTPRLMPLLHSGIQWPVVMDSFTLFRYQMVMKRILRSRWKFHYDREVGYLDADTEAKVRALISSSAEWTPALPAPSFPKPGKEEEEDEAAMVEESSPTPLTGKLPTTLEEWWHRLPEWFRDATKTGLEVEEWANALFTNRLRGKPGVGKGRRATIPSEDDLEGILAEWATQQHQLRNNYIHLKLSDSADERLQYYGFSEGRDPAEAVGCVGFLKDLLVISRDATAEYLRNNETLLLRMMARHVPIGQWEWFMSDGTLSPMFDRGGEMVTEDEHIKEKTYRDQVRRLRLQTISGYAPPADETEAIVPRGPTYADMSALWAWYNLHADTEEQYNRALGLMAELMPTIPRMERRVDYTPDPDAMAPLIEKLDIQGVPNSMRDAYLRSTEMEDTTLSSSVKGSTIGGLEERVSGTRERDEGKGKKGKERKRGA